MDIEEALLAAEGRENWPLVVLTTEGPRQVVDEVSPVLVAEIRRLQKREALVGELIQAVRAEPKLTPRTCNALWALAVTE